MSPINICSEFPFPSFLVPRFASILPNGWNCIEFYCRTSFKKLYDRVIEFTKQESNFVLLYVGTIGGGKRYNIAALIHCLRLSNFDKHTVYTSDCGSLLTNLVLKMRLIFLKTFIDNVVNKKFMSYNQKMTFVI
jgi:hypothetical protein